MLSACGNSPITATRLDAALGPTFTHLYAYQQQLIGNPADASVYAIASCQRSGAGSANAGASNAGASNAGGTDSGAGDDWVCGVTVYRKTGAPIAASIEVKVKTNGCYVADPPISVVGPTELTLPDGSSADNPLSEFDGCFDTA